MNDSTSGEVQETKVTQSVHAENWVPAPRPTTLHRVDKSGHYHCEGEEGKELHSLGHGTGHNGHCSGNKNYLEKEVRRGSICGIFLPSLNSARICDRAEEDISSVHDAVAHHHVHNARYREERNIFGQDLDSVFRPDQSGLEHSESSGHPHDQRSTYEEVESVQRILQLKNIVFHERVLQRSGLQRFLAGLAGSDAGYML